VLPPRGTPVPWKWPADAEGEACAGRPQEGGVQEWGTPP